MARREIPRNARRETSPERYLIVRISTASGSERLLAERPLATARGTDSSPQSMFNHFVNRALKRNSVKKRGLLPHNRLP
jgi:hypothetical protein